jgi:23S rRNA (adenine-N6)-dimethyltransferase
VIASVLARRCKQVIAVEIEPQALKQLQKNVGDIPNIQILSKSILNITPPSTTYKIFSNIPFSISADVVRHFVFAEYPPKAMYLIAQKQFARKLVPGDDHFTSALGAQLYPFFTARIRKPLRKTDFTPPPAVDTVLLELKVRDTSLIDHTETGAYCAWIEQCFHDVSYFRRQPLASANISAEQIPSRLNADDWVHLWRTLVQ